MRHAPRGGNRPRTPRAGAGRRRPDQRAQGGRRKKSTTLSSRLSPPGAGRGLCRPPVCAEWGFFSSGIVPAHCGRGLRSPREAARPAKQTRAHGAREPQPHRSLLTSTQIFAVAALALAGSASAAKNSTYVGKLAVLESVEAKKVRARTEARIEGENRARSPAPSFSTSPINPSTAPHTLTPCLFSHSQDEIKDEAWELAAAKLNKVRGGARREEEREESDARAGAFFFPLSQPALIHPFLSHPRPCTSPTRSSSTRTRPRRR
jgi:hypothetical protein